MRIVSGAVVAGVILLISTETWCMQRPDFFVSTSGNDAWSGQLAEPNPAKTDGPFATFQRAQEAVRKLRAAQPNRPESIVVMVRGGVYVLEKPIEILPAESGTADSRTVYSSFAAERPVFSGGTRLSGWKADEEGRWSVQIPEVQKGEWYFEQLWVNGQRRYRPRLPKEGFYTIADQVEPQPGARGYDRFKFSGDDIRGDWANIGDVEVLGFQVWTMARLRIAKVDAQQKLVVFTGPTRSTSSWSNLAKGHRFLVENVKEALEKPGEWYLDRPSGTLTYIPLPGERIDTAEVIAPRLDELVQIKGNPAAKQWVQNVTLRGLTFTYANWVSPPEGNNFSQAEVNIGGAISLSGARDCIIEDCQIKSVGTYAIDIGAACQGNRVERCEMTDLGAGGVKLGLMSMENDEQLLTGRQIVRDNLIAHGGRLHPAAIGVWIGHSPNNRVEHNDIADFYYTGVSVGWRWGYAASQAHHNVITQNRIHHIGQGVLSDMGGIYTLGPSPGSELTYNLIHDIDAFDYGGWGIYFDEGTTGMLAENNIVYNTKTGGFHQHYGRENILRNNIFAFTKRDQLQRTRMEPHLSFTFERNIVIYRQGQLLGSNWSDDKYILRNNIYWRTDGRPVLFPGKLSLEQWQQKKHQDEGSLVADPQFVDAEKYDFRLKPGSPADKIGFKPIDISKAGRLGKQPEAGLDPPAFPTLESK